MKAFIEAETMDELEAVFCAASLLLKRPDEAPAWRRIYRFPIIPDKPSIFPTNPAPSAMPGSRDIEVETTFYRMRDECDVVTSHFGFRCRRRQLEKEPEDELPTEIPREELEQLMRDNPGFALYVQEFIQKKGPLKESLPGMILLDEPLGFMTAIISKAMEKRRS